MARASALTIHTVNTLDAEEYRVLRETVRDRGSLRVTLFVATLTAWAVVTTLLAAFLSLPLASVLPLILLMAGFEAVHQLHVGAERIGRYLFVRYESGISHMHWEGAIAAFGAGHKPSTHTSDALFSGVFMAAVVVGLLMAGLAATPFELLGLGALHALAIVRIGIAKRSASKQRAEDQARFEQLFFPAGQRERDQ